MVEQHSVSEETDEFKIVGPEERRGKLVYQLPASTIHHTINISDNDHLILGTWKRIRKESMTAVIHNMIGQSSICWRENHAEKITDLEKKIEQLKWLLQLYRQRFGPIKLKAQRSAAEQQLQEASGD